MFVQKKPDESSRRSLMRSLALLSLLGLVMSAFRTVGDYSIALSEFSVTRTASVQPATESRSLELPYKPSPVEDYIIQHTSDLGWKVSPPQLVTTCTIWKDSSATPYHKELMTYAIEVREYYHRLRAFKLPPGITDLRKQKDVGGNDICTVVDMKLPTIFSTSGQLTQTRSGWVEPLLPPMRHPSLCLVDEQKLLYKDLVSIEYLIHDWAHMCRQLKPHSRTVFIDMGAALRFHGKLPSPALQLLEQYRQMGFVFDHIYGYEMRQELPDLVFKALPPQYLAAFHWINCGVNQALDHIHNPWNLLLDHYNEDDFIVVKLDIDTPAVEKDLAHQLFNNPRLLKLVDQFYFEHHVNQLELAGHWGPTTESVDDSFQFFSGLRQKGVAAHFWV